MIITKAEFLEMVEDWETDKGYAEFDNNDTTYYIPGALHIAKIDEMNMFDDDVSACKQAKKDGVKFINDIRGIRNNMYIDTVENREIINAYLSTK